MKKILIICALIVSALFVVGGYRDSLETMQVKLYYVDSSMQRLIPSDYVVKASTPNKAAKQVIHQLIEGQDNNTKIMRLIPKIEDGLSVRVMDNTAYVNMTKDFITFHSDSRQHELLTIYSIVNSLTSIDGIVNVKFTIDGKEEKDFKGFCDMRETFIPDYYI